MTISVITCTGDRSIPFALCQQWMKKQTCQPNQWIVVDDGAVPSRMVVACDYVRREPQKSDPVVTMILNLKEALLRVTGDYIIIFEDDEYYAPNYIEEMVKRLDKYEVVGIGKSKYYHLAGGYLLHDNMTHASFAQTAFRKNKIPILESTFNGDCFLDIRFWEKANGFIFDDGEENPLYVGIKGLPGRAGIGQGHLFDSNYTGDADRKILKKWIPKDYQTYLDIIKKVKFGKMKLNIEGGRRMGQYKAIKKGYIPGLGIIEAGRIFPYDGPKGSWMVPVETIVKETPLAEANPIFDAAKKVSESHGLPSDQMPVKNEAKIPQHPIDRGFRPKAKGKR